MSKFFFKDKRLSNSFNIIKHIYSYMYRIINKNIAKKLFKIMNIINVDIVTKWSYKSRIVERKIQITGPRKLYMNIECVGTTSCKRFYDLNKIKI